NIPFARWLSRNVRDQKQPGYSAVTLSLKPAGVAPGDVTDRQLEKIADLADQFSFGELRSTHNQNIVLADVLKSDLFDLWQLAKADGLATPNIGTINDIICCPGGDYCSLANAKSIPVAEAIQRKFEDLDYVYDLGDLELNISGCMNACGHHHVGHIGILGVDKKGEEWYQIQIGGSASKQAALAKVLGPSLSRDAVVEGIEKLLDVYIEHRQPEETFLATYQRIGMDKFKVRVYAEHS
ncbi:MAG TPA: sulfite reductase, partial [Porticoccaceae bacterium]|nr:sulfite reductase [Porticoccaceae bacterium]